MTYTCSRAAFVLLAATFAGAVPAGAQPAPPQSIESMPVHFGPLGLAPSISITNVGRDSNVFDDATNPQDDLTATVAPRLAARLRARRLLFSYGSATDIVYFQKFKSERSVNSTTDLKLEADLGRLQPYTSVSFIDTKERLNAELDARAPRTQRAYVAGTRALLASRTAVVVSVRRFELEFDPDVRFRGVELARTLNSRTDSVDVGMQRILTPLTTFGVTGSIQHDRFDHAPERDSDTLRILPAFQFDPSSLLRGSLAVGYRRFTPRDVSLPDYSGLLVQSNLGLTLLGRTKLDIDLLRDVQYSYEEFQPYYLSTGGRLVVTHQLMGRLDVQGVGGRQVLAYREARRSGVVRRDRSETVGAGVGFHVRTATRFALNWELNRRLSGLDQRQYTRRRLFASLTVGS